MNHASSRRQARPAQPAVEAKIRLRRASRIIDDLLTGRSTSPLLDAARVAHLVDEAKSLLWAASWQDVA
jgi:hypothetical protein